MRAHWLGLVLLSVVAGCDPSITYGGHRPDLSGHVMIDAHPAAGVTVVANDGSGDHKTQTGSDGAYAFSQLRFGQVTVHVEVPLIVFSSDTKQVDLGNGEVQVDFFGFAPVAISGNVFWEYVAAEFMGIPNVPIHVQTSVFPVDDVVTDRDGSFRFQRVPGLGSYPVMFGALPPGLIYRDGNQWTYNSASPRGDGLTDTAYVIYRPAAGLMVQVDVDGQPYDGVTVVLNTPIPIRHRPATFINLPAQPLDVSITGYPPSITFDATVQSVQFGAGNFQIVTFTGYTPGANRPPEVTISAPANAATFTVGTPITFSGSGHDLEDGNLTGNSLHWHIPGVGTLGHGVAITIDTLPVGRHRIVLGGTDSRGSLAQAFIDITIVPATGGRVVGVVTVDGAPAAGTRLDLSTSPSRFAVTDAQGAYAFEDVPAGSYVVTLREPRCTVFPTTTQGVSVTIGARTTANFAGVGMSYCYGAGLGAGHALRRRH